MSFRDVGERPRQTRHKIALPKGPVGGPFRARERCTASMRFAGFGGVTVSTWHWRSHVSW